MDSPLSFRHNTMNDFEEIHSSIDSSKADFTPASEENFTPSHSDAMGRYLASYQDAGLTPPPSEHEDTPASIAPDYSIRMHSTSLPSVGEVPQPGGVYMIREIHSGKLITLFDGKIILTDKKGGQGGWLWVCEERCGNWLGFRDLVSAYRLGLDIESNCFRALGLRQCTGLENSSKFVLRPAALGEYNLCVHDIMQDSLKAMTITSAGVTGLTPNLIIGEATATGNAARWQFIRLNGDPWWSLEQSGLLS